MTPAEADGGYSLPSFPSSEESSCLSSWHKTASRVITSIGRTQKQHEELTRKSWGGLRYVDEDEDGREHRPSSGSCLKATSHPPYRSSIVVSDSTSATWRDDRFLARILLDPFFPAFRKTQCTKRALWIWELRVEEHAAYDVGRSRHATDRGD